MASTEFSKTYFEKADEENAFKDYAPFRYGKVKLDASDEQRIRELRKDLDPILVDIVDGGIEASIVEAEAAVERAARSTIVREQHDYRASLNSLDCLSVSRVSWAATADPIRMKFPVDQIFDGDVFIYNDVYGSAGTIGHLPDYCVVTPIFWHERLLGFAQIFGHVNDVGGRVPGSWPNTSTSIFEEGTICPPVKLYEKGKLSSGVYDIILRNSRFPEDLRGDVDAFVGANEIIKRRVKELCDRFGGDRVEAAFYEIMDRCAEVVREKGLPLIPDGEYVGEDFVENDGLTLDKPVKIRITIRKYADKMILDFDGTSPQTAGPVNWSLDGRHYSKWLGAFFKAQIPGIIINDGITQVFRCRVPRRTVLSSEFPAPVVSRMTCMLRMISAYTVALTKAFKGQVVADMQNIQIYGFYGQSDEGKLFLMREIFGAGSGARPYADGTDAVDLVPHSKNLPAEFVEQRFPVIVERVGLAIDSGGPGKYRGGLGYVKELKLLADGSYLTVTERTAFACFGVNGGKWGAPGYSLRNPGTPEEEYVYFSRDAVPAKAGDIVRLVTPGGGGWGDPLEREIGSVRLDVERKLVSLESARRDYGVVMDPTSLEVDQSATEKLRRRLADERGPIKLIDRGPYAETMIKKGMITVSDPEAECMRCADDKVLERYWKDLYKYTHRPIGCH
ncbi:MAG TPA: hydantoinase B/oxoprolinase family protein [Candidatus Binataceae bacterium]|nr:hydantoinase B/oxoprolinase family protein [Candidatus Binataceae bacterium]